MVDEGKNPDEELEKRRKKRLAEENGEVKLSDQTLIDGQTWEDLKEWAMRKDYQE